MVLHHPLDLTLAIAWVYVRGDTQSGEQSSLQQEVLVTMTTKHCGAIYLLHGAIQWAHSPSWADQHSWRIVLVSPSPHPLPDSETCTERQDGGAKYVNFVQHFNGCRTHICYSCGRNSRSSQLASYSLFKGLGNARLQNSILCREKCQVLTKFSILLLWKKRAGPNGS